MVNRLLSNTYISRRWSTYTDHDCIVCAIMYQVPCIVIHISFRRSVLGVLDWVFCPSAVSHPPSGAKKGRLIAILGGRWLGGSEARWLGGSVHILEGQIAQGHQDPEGSHNRSSTNHNRPSIHQFNWLFWFFLGLELFSILIWYLVFGIWYRGRALIFPSLFPVSCLPARSSRQRFDRV